MEVYSALKSECAINVEVFPPRFCCLIDWLFEVIYTVVTEQRTEETTQHSRSTSQHFFS
jgi:hypothetical protein